MKASDLQAAVAANIPVGDERAARAVCDAFRVLRDFLRKNVTEGKGVGGFVFRTLFPKTAEGIKAVVTLLDDYLAQNCG